MSAAYVDIELPPIGTRLPANQKLPEAPPSRPHRTRRSLCFCGGLAVGALTGGTAVAALGVDRRSHLQLAAPTRGWLVERLFHSEGIICPWTSEPQSDADCLDRHARIERLRSNLSVCAEPLRRNTRTFAHRGAALVAPEETVVSWTIGIESGASLIECDASLDGSGQFVCRHSTCDLATTTDVLLHEDLRSKCSRPFVPANGSVAASAHCCTFDFTSSELTRLCAEMDGTINRAAASAEAYRAGPPGFRSGYLAAARCHPLVWYKEYLQLAAGHSV